MVMSVERSNTLFAHKNCIGKNTRAIEDTEPCAVSNEYRIKELRRARNTHYDEEKNNDQEATNVGIMLDITKLLGICHTFGYGGGGECRLSKDRALFRRHDTLVRNIIDEVAMLTSFS